MLTLFAILAVLVLFIAMAAVGVTVNEFTKKMDVFNKLLEMRYSLEPLLKPKVKQTAKTGGESKPAAAAPGGASPLDALLKKPKA